MRQGIIIGIIIIALFVVGCTPQVKEPDQVDVIPPQVKEPKPSVDQVDVIPPQVKEPKLSADQVDIIPAISIQECLAQIQQTNPEMSDQAAQDNCYSIEAVNKEDKSLCDKVSEGFRANCLTQFE